MHTTLVPAAVTANFSNGLAALVFILAAYGLLNVFGLADEKSYWRLGVIILMIGVVFQNVPVISSLGGALRNGVNSLFIRIGFPEFASDVVLMIILILLVAFLFTKHQKSKPGDNKWMWLSLAAGVVLMTIPLVATGTSWVTDYAAQGLGWLPNANF